jgi:hypothetical protein
LVRVWVPAEAGGDCEPFFHLEFIARFFNVPPASASHPHRLGPAIF